MSPEERAREFCQGAFGPFGVDIEPYTKIVTELIEGAETDLRAENARLREEVEDERAARLAIEKTNAWHILAKQQEVENDRLRAENKTLRLEYADWKAAYAEVTYLRAESEQLREYATKTRVALEESTDENVRLRAVNAEQKAETQKLYDFWVRMLEIAEEGNE